MSEHVLPERIDAFARVHRRLAEAATYLTIPSALTLASCTCGAPEEPVPLPPRLSTLNDTDARYDADAPDSQLLFPEEENGSLEFDLEDVVTDDDGNMDFSNVASLLQPSETDGAVMEFSIEDVANNLIEVNYDGPGKIYISSIYELIHRAALAHKSVKYLPVYYGIGSCETQFQPDGISWAGAAGACQIMPKTVAHMAETFPQAGKVAVFNPVIGKSGRRLLPMDRDKSFYNRREHYAIQLMEARNRIAEKHGIEIVRHTILIGKGRTKRPFPFSRTELSGLSAQQLSPYIEDLTALDWRFNPYLNSWYEIHLLHNTIQGYRGRGFDEMSAIILSIDAYNRGDSPVNAMIRRVGPANAAKTSMRTRDYVRCVMGRTEAFMELAKNRQLDCQGISVWADAEQAKVNRANEVIRRSYRTKHARIPRGKMKRARIPERATEYLCRPYIVYQPD